MKQGQNWSIDLITAVIIFILIISIFYAFLSKEATPKITDLSDETSSVADKLKSPDTGIIVEELISSAQFNELCDLPYEEVKRRLGVENELCIYIEDQNGNLIPCGVSGSKAGIGNGNDVVLGAGVTCGSSI